MKKKIGKLDILPKKFNKSLKVAVTLLSVLTVAFLILFYVWITG